ncbi:Gp15 family bacteriophage protein [Anaerovorax odorimutans]|uniref:Gp15 family bacteriophage protein n=1 Tax=Anaerovorax odorimutans TaxID=109327 RepID=A0ABT1RP90_9FIRM|nr:Gp15 family bacteriophage protein [Anaerovorax odorimutans]MCQ4637019.1 Gp15 family bacteriophage protein [Anaerovorax odorimutans]
MNPRESSDAGYDLVNDFGLIVSSFQTQYGIRLSKELDSMKWDEFRDLISGLNERTPLGNIIAIRTETDPDAIKAFSPEARRIHDEWQNKRAEEITPQDYERAMRELEDIMKGLAGG